LDGNMGEMDNMWMETLAKITNVEARPQAIGREAVLHLPAKADI
jgi:hypothetical protein